MYQQHCSTHVARFSVTKKTSAFLEKGGKSEIKLFAF
jgi:hypothetical protein